MENNLLSEELIYNGESETQTHLHLYTYNSISVEETSSSSFKTIKPSLCSNKINWLQIHGLKNTATIRQICSNFELDFLILQDILNTHHLTQSEIHDNYIVLYKKLFKQIDRKSIGLNTIQIQ